MHAEDLALRKGEVVAVAAVGQHPSGWWEGFTKGGRYGLVAKHGIEPLFDNESSESIGLGMMADIPPEKYWHEDRWGETKTSEWREISNLEGLGGEALLGTWRRRRPPGSPSS